MKLEQSYVIAAADRMRSGEELSFATSLLMAGFGSDVATLEAAVCSHLFGGRDGAYRLRVDWLNSTLTRR